MGLFTASAPLTAQQQAERDAQIAANKAANVAPMVGSGASQFNAPAQDIAGESLPTGSAGPGQDSFEQPLGPDLRGTVPPTSPGGGTFTEFNDEFNKGQLKRAQATEEMFGRMPKGPTGQRDVVQGEGENFLPTGGRSEFEETYKAGPQRLAQAQKELGQLTAGKSEAMSQQYQRSAQQATEAMAANKARRAHDDQEIAVRQQNLDKAVQHYSNDLADQGKFWTSPGNIISAIAFSLMPVFSNDPAIGAKLINQAIDRDMTNRKDLANMHLGELRSNLGNYRKLAEDHNVGDQIAQSEAHRLAALEIERISANFDSPIAKEKAKAMVEDQLMRAGQTRQVAYNHYNYNTVRRLDPRVAGAFEAPGKAGNTDAWKSFTVPGNTPGKAIQGSIAGSPTTAATDKTPVSIQGLKPTQLAALAHSPGEVAKMGLDGRLDKDGLTSMYGRIIAKRADSLVPPGTANYAVKYNEEVERLQKASDAGVAEIAKVAQPFQVGLAVTTRLQRDMDIIERECRQAGINPNEFLGEMRAGLGGPLTSKIQDLRNRLDSSGDSASERETVNRRQASERFHQAMSGKIVGYYHDLAGAAQNPAETGNLKQVISSEASWEKMKTFIQGESQNYAQQVKGAIAASPDPYSAALYMAQNGNGTSPRVGSVGIEPPNTRNPVSTVRGPNAGAPPPLKEEFVP